MLPAMFWPACRLPVLPTMSLHHHRPGVPGNSAAGREDSDRLPFPPIFLRLCKENPLPKHTVSSAETINNLPHEPRTIILGAGFLGKGLSP